jgi:hypothetical protein
MRNGISFEMILKAAALVSETSRFVEAAPPSRLAAGHRLGEDEQAAEQGKEEQDVEKRSKSANHCIPPPGAGPITNI